MSSLCIKTNNDEILKYLQNEFKDFNMLNVSFSSNEFKNYKNVIIHYKGTDTELFYTKLATILSYLVIEYFENSIIKTILISNYFYFDNYEIEKEYLEFISLLKLYVNSQLPITPIIHLVSSNLGILLLDENLNIIELDKSNLNTKYLSDISFSDNDYVLNTLLNLLPRKLYLHLANNSPENFEFINTIKLVFENRIEICTNCDICNLYSKRITTSKQ